MRVKLLFFWQVVSRAKEGRTIDWAQSTCAGNQLKFIPLQVERNRPSPYGAARQSIFQKLDPIHHNALRMCSGAFRTSPIHNLYADCREPSLNFRRSQLAIKYYFNLKSLNLEPYSNRILCDQYTDLYRARPFVHSSFGYARSSADGEVECRWLSPNNNRLFQYTPMARNILQLQESLQRFQ